MTTENLGLFKALGAKMNYLDQRQRVISQNIANADTPGYQPKDLLPVDFSRVMKKVTNSANVTPETTNSLHMPANNKVADPKNREQRTVYEEAPVGNAVILEEQMVNSNKNQIDYNLMTNLYQKNVNMIRTALGRNGG